jgi:glycolate oxidase FAD binding subunit
MAGAGASRRAVELFGGNSKRLMAGQITEAELRITTAKMRQILQYEPRDLTISVEAGVPLAQLNAELAKNGQMIPLDGPYGEDATIGGVVAANINGPRRKVCGTARDLIIGMKFATLDGKLVDSGGMVVKNVAGLDMGKLMIGSFGTLAAIASVNFKLLPRPAAARTMIFAFDDLRPAMEVRDAALRGQLNPAAVEMVNPLLSPQLGLRGYALAILFAGTEAVIERSVRDASAWGSGRLLTVEEEPRFWSSLQQITPRFLEKFREGAVVRVSTTIADCGEALGSLEGPGHAHAASGIVRGWFTRPEAAARWLSAATGRGWKGLVEFTSESARPGLTLWPEPGPDFAIMKEVKRLFDPEGLLNRGRLYGRI